MQTLGTLLKHWRAVRGMSQLDLAVHANVSPRHLSAIETGKSRPSAELVRRLGVVLDVPFREVNLLLASAGHAAAHAETPLEDLGRVAQTLDQLLAAHEPNMALLLDRHFDLVRSNPAAARFLFAAFPEPPAWLVPPVNLVRLHLHPQGLRSVMLDWEVSAAAWVRRLEREVAARPGDHDLEALLVEVSDHPDVATLPRAVPPSAAPVQPVTYKLDGREIRLFSTVATVSGAHDLTLAELRMETSFPADDASAENWRTVIGTHQP